MSQGRPICVPDATLAGSPQSFTATVPSAKFPCVRGSSHKSSIAFPSTGSRGTRWSSSPYSSRYLTAATHRVFNRRWVRKLLFLVRKSHPEHFLHRLRNPPRSGSHISCTSDLYLVCVLGSLRCADGGQHRSQSASRSRHI